MGNSPNKGQHSLAKNWSPHGSNAYINNITGQLIDCHLLTARTHEQLTFHNNLLMKRAGLNHPNVLKLLYFCNAGTDTLCSNVSYRTQIYLQHAASTLEAVVGEQKNAEDCICCPIVNGVKYLLERYGPFSLSAKQVWLVGDKLCRKKVAKVWIHSDPKQNQLQQQISQEWMSRQLLTLLEKSNCTKTRDIKMEKFRNIKEAFDFVYEKHQQQPVGHQVRKRVTSQMEGKKEERKGVEQSVNQTTSREKEAQNKSKLSPSPATQFQFKEFSTPRNREGSNDIFYRPKVKQNSIFRPIETGFQKKVNFSYTNGLATPKYNRSYHQKTIYQSPQISAVLHKGFEHHQSCQTIKEPKMPVFVSRFNQETDLHIQQAQTEAKLQQLINTERKKTESVNLLQQRSKVQQNDQEVKVDKKEVKVEQIISQVFLPQSSTEVLPTFGNQLAKKRQSTLQLSKNLQISYSSQDIKPDQVNTKEGARSSRFKIASEYKLAVEPERHSQTEVDIDASVTEERQEMMQSSKENVHRLSPPSGLNFEPTAISEDGREHSKHETHNNETSYMSCVKKLEEVKLSESEIPKVKAISSQRLRPSQMLPGESSPSPKYLNGTMDRSKRQSYNIQIQKPSLNNRRESRKTSEELKSLYNHSCSSDEREQKKKALILAKIQNTEEILKANKRRLEELQLEQDLEHERGVIKQEVDSLLMGKAEQKRIKEKVKHKQATFAQLKAEASKLLEDLNF